MWRRPENFFDLAALKGEPLAALFEGRGCVWEVLDGLEPFILKTARPNVTELRRRGDLTAEAAGIQDGRVWWGVTYELGETVKGGLRVYHRGRRLEGAALVMPGVALVGEDIEIGPEAVLETGVMIKGPAVIGPRAEVRQGAYIRGSVFAAPGSVIGHATEAKNVLLLAGAKAGHFAYLGDSLLGREVNLGAGTKLANLKLNDLPFLFKVDGRTVEVRRRKFGAVLGDGVVTGCNAVTNPGVLLGPDSKVLPNVSVPPGYHPGRSILRGR